MPLKENKTHEKIKNSKNKKFLFIIISIFLVFVLITSFVLLYFVFADVPINLRILKDNNTKILKLAEDYYSQGYLENSAVYFKNYLSLNPNKVEKIRVYERLFEISVISNNYEDAFNYLNDWQKIDKNNPKIFINKVKLLLRQSEYVKVKNEIDTHYDKYKKSPEFRELIAVYYIKSGFYDKALNELNQISFNKREFSIHKKIIYCYLKLDQFSNAASYVERIEPKIKSLGLKERSGEFTIIKSVVLILKGNIEEAREELLLGNISQKYESLSLKLKLYCDIVLDKITDINSIVEKKATISNFETEFSGMVGDYFIYKGDYQKASVFYEDVKSKKKLTEGETMTLVDIYYRNADYKECIDNLKILYSDFNYRSPNFYKNISIAYKKSGDEQSETFYLKEGKTQYPDDLDFYVRIISNLIASGDSKFARQNIEDAKIISRKLESSYYDRRLDVLQILAMQVENGEIEERQLLDLREKWGTNAEYYFKLLEYYLKNKKIQDAHREMESVLQLPLDDKQKENVNIYRLILASLTENQGEFDEVKKTILLTKNPTLFTNINIAIIKILEYDYQNALDILNTISLDTISDELKKKIFYLKAVVYYYKKDYPSSYKLIQNVLELDAGSNKAIYMRNLIEDSTDLF
jgi:tetratricopeptide (TPR) repeat protein